MASIPPSSRPAPGLWVALAIAGLIFFLAQCAASYAEQLLAPSPGVIEIAISAERTARLPVPAVYADPDSLCWIVYAQTLARKGEWRLRESPIGNAPNVRPMLWAHAYLWWVMAIGGVTAFIAGVSWPDGIALGVPATNPLAFVIFLIAWGRLVARHAGRFPAAVGVFLLCGFGAIGRDFAWWHPDHHGFHFCALLGALTADLFAIKRNLEDEAASSDRLFIVAGVAGGIGLWIGATQQVTVVALLGLLALAGAVFLPHERLAAWERGWLRWALAGAGVSLAALVIEFAPDFADLRLEVNHPFFAASWLGGGLLVRGVARWRLGVTSAGVSLVVGGALALVLPVGILLTPISEYSLRDPTILRFCELIDEFRPIFRSYSVTNLFREVGLFALLLVGVGVGLFRTRVVPALHWPALLAAGVSLAYGLLSCVQMRWASWAEAGLVLCGIVLAIEAERLRGEPRSVPHRFLAGTAVVLLAFMAYDLWSLWQNRGTIRPVLATAIGTRDLAYWLRGKHGSEALSVLGNPSLAPGLYAFGRIRTIDALYWENQPGVHAATEMLSATDDRVAEKLIRDRKVTHLVIPAAPAMVKYAGYVGLGTDDPVALRQILAWRLACPEPQIPPWLVLEDSRQFLGSTVVTRIYRVLESSDR